MLDKLRYDSIATRLKNFRKVLKQIILEIDNNIIHEDKIKVVSLLIDIFNAHKDNNTAFIRRLESVTQDTRLGNPNKTDYYRDSHYVPPSMRSSYSRGEYSTRAPYYMGDYHSYYASQTPKPICEDTLKKIKTEGIDKLKLAESMSWYTVTLGDNKNTSNEKVINETLGETTHEKDTTLKVYDGSGTSGSDSDIAM